MKGKQNTRRRWVYPNLTDSLMGQVDQAIEKLQSFGVQKYANRRAFIEAAIVEKLQKEGSA